MSASSASDKFLNPRFLSAVSGLIFVLWMLSLWLVPKVASNAYDLPSCDVEQMASVKQIDIDECNRQKIAAYGVLGDSFGAVNALFTGLALAGVVLTLLLHSEAARRVAKPFVVPIMLRDNSDASVSVGMPSWSGAHINLPISVKIPISNQSVNPALNVCLAVTFEKVSNAANYHVAVPLSSAATDVCSVSVDVIGDEAAKFVKALVDGDAKFTIRSEYESVEGVRWYSTASYLLKINDTDPSGLELLRTAIDGNHSDGGAWASKSTVHLDFSTLPGTWKYGEVGGSKKL